MRLVRLLLLAPALAAAQLSRLECLTDRARGFSRGAWADALADARALANASYVRAWPAASVLGDAAHSDACVHARSAHSGARGRQK